VQAMGQGSEKQGSEIWGVIMDYVALLKFRSSVPAAERDGALMRRAAWEYPKGVRMIAEYWPLSSAVTVVTIFSTDSFEQLLELELEWSDVFDIDIHPAVAADEGLRIGPDVVGRLARLQPQT
jgi:hypothetical protein